jgi:CheY-like chemotaxis protein
LAFGLAGKGFPMAAAALTISDSQERVPAILVVEDEVLIRFAIADYLRECGYRVLEASHAAEAIEIIQGNIQLDLVFSDVQMPGEMDGFALARWIRANRPKLPVTLTSGDTQKSAKAKDLCENEPFFAKPYDVEIVVAHIRSRLYLRKPDQD